MKQTNTLSSRGSVLSKLLLFVLFMLAGTVNSWSADKNIIKLELDKDYELGMANSYYYYEATENGRLQLSSNSTDLPSLFSDDTFTTMLTMKMSPDRTSATFNVEAGKTYYLMGFSLNSGATFKASLLPAITSISLAKATPEVGSILNIIDDSSIYLNFDEDVESDDIKATISAGQKSADLVVESTNKNVKLYIRKTLYDWYTSGDVKEGDKITLHLSNIHAEGNTNLVYGTDGNLTVEYITDKAPVGLESASSKLPAVFKSFWAQGDEDGIIKLVFNGNLLENNSSLYAVLNYGNKDNNEFYTEDLPISVKGNTITVDLTNKQRTAQTMIPGATNQYNTINVKIGGVKDANGKTTYSERDGLNGSYNYNFQMEDVTEDIAYDFTPIDGGSIDNTKDVEIYLTSSKVLGYTGVRFDYTINDERKSVVVEKAQLTEQPEDEGWVINAPVPDDVKGGKAVDVTVSLNEQSSLDGAYHAPVSAHYNVVKFNVKKPTFNGAIEALHEGDEVEVETNYTDRIGAVSFEIVNTYNGRPIKEAEFMTASDQGIYTYKLDADYTLVKGQTYGLVFNAYANNEGDITGKVAAGSDTLKVEGNTESANYNWEPTMVSPETGETLKSLSEIELTFDDNVVINPNVTNEITALCLATRQSIKGTADVDMLDSKKVIISFEKEITASEEGVTDDYYVDIPEGLIGNSEFASSGYTSGLANPLLSYTYTIGEESSETDVVTTDPAIGSNVKSLKRVVIEFTNATDVGSAYSDKKIEVLDEDGNVVCEATSDIDMSIEELNKIPVDLNEEITKDGVYTIHIPAGYYLLNEGVKESSELNLVYAVGNAVIKKDVEADPADGSTVNSLKQITLTWTKESSVAQGFNSDEPITVTNAAGETVTTVNENTGIEFGADFNQMVINLSDEITTNGVYTVHVPAGKFVLGDEGDRNSAAFTLTYYIGNTDNINIANTVSDSVFKVYNTEGVLMMVAKDKSQLKQLNKGLYIINNKKVIIK